MARRLHRPFASLLRFNYFREVAKTKTENVKQVPYEGQRRVRACACVCVRERERESLTETSKYSLLVKRTKSWTSLRSVSSKFIGPGQASPKGHVYEFMNIVKARYPAKLSFYVGSGQEFTCPSYSYGKTGQLPRNYIPKFVVFEDL